MNGRAVGGLGLAIVLMAGGGPLSAADPTQSTEEAAMPFSLTSTAFTQGRPIPALYTGVNALLERTSCSIALRSSSPVSRDMSSVVK